jgi:iron complex outermembrane receptor protein
MYCFQRRTILNLTGAASAFVALSMSSPALAEDPTADIAADAVEAPADSGAIIVSARRKNERLQDVPLSVNVLGTEAIRNQAIVGPEDIARLTPGIAATTSGTVRNGSSYTIRGQGQTSGGDIAVVTYFNDVATSTPGPGFIFDLANVQVLKGPQGTLFGRNTTGGAVLLTPQMPTNDTEGYLDLTVGSYSHRRVQAAVNVPLIDDKLLLRVATDLYWRKGFTRDVDTGQDYDDRNYKAVRAILLAKPSDVIENMTSFHYSFADGNQAGTSLINIKPGSTYATRYPGIIAEVEAQQKRGPRLVRYGYQDGRSVFRALAMDNTTTVHLSDTVQLKNIIGYRDTRVLNFDDTDGTIYPATTFFAHPGWQTYAYPDPPLKGLSEELQLSGKAFSSKLDFTTGLYYERRNPATEDGYDLSSSFGGAPVVGQALRYDRSFGIYAQLAYEVLPRLTFTAGGRYTWDSRHQIASRYIEARGCEASAALSGYYCRLDQSAKFHAPTYTLNLQYKVNRDVMFYATNRRGYKSGGFNTAFPSMAYSSYRPEYVTDYEAGVKGAGSIASVPVRLNAAVYRTNFKDKQISGRVYGDDGAVYNVALNSGHGHVQGIELDGAFSPIPQFELSGSFAYTDGKYKSLISGGIDYSNQPIAGVSKYKYSVNGTLKILDEDQVGQVSAVASYSWQSKFSGTLNTSTLFTTNPLGSLTPAYDQLNLRLNWNSVLGSKLDASVAASNLLNKTYIIFLSDAYDTQGYTRGTYNEPRMINFEVRYRF